MTVGRAENQKSDFATGPMGRRLGHYEIIGELGSGGMGVVYRAYDPALKRYAALKLIRTDNPELAIRFVQEAQAQARVQHDYVCRVYEVGEVQGKQYIAMQLIEGKTLGDTSKEMSVEDKVRVIKQIADALQVAHKQGLIHRDIKPSNIMLERSEEGGWKPYVMDFGLARDQGAPGLTRTGVAVGTPFYMAPEQVSGHRDQLDRRTDVYGLGATLYELLSGKPPYQGDSAPEIMMKILRDDPVRISKVLPQIPRDLETIVMKCLERDPSRRYESSRALSEDLQRYLDGDPLAAKPTSRSYRLIKRAKKNRVATAIALSAAAITFVLVAFFLWFQWQARLRTTYARLFDDEVKNIQAVLPRIYTAPLHDVRPELEALRIRLEKMETSMKEGGRAALDPGNNALGQGYLALGEVEKARDHLEKAWRAGYQLPSTAYALGQTMGLLFQKKLAEAERNSSEELRKRMKKQYEKEYRDPAVQYLKKAEGSVESLAYVEGLIALYEKRYDDALKKAQQAYARSNWSYEAKLLEGKALAGKAQKQLDVSDYRGAIQQYQLAGEAYSRASELGRSRADIYLSDCDRWGKIMEAQTYTDIIPTGSLPDAEEACKNAILVNPDDPASHLRTAHMYARLARYQAYTTSDDPRILLRKSMESAKEAERKDPKGWEASHMLGTSSMIWGEYELRHGINPENTLREAVRHFQQALAVNENYPDVWRNLGVTYSYVGEYESQSGRNPVPMFEKALQQYQRIEQLLPGYDTGNESGIAYSFIATYETNHGEDPSPSLRQSIEQYKKRLKVAPDDPYPLYNLGSVYTQLGDYEMSTGKDPISSYRQALECQQKAGKFIPNNTYILNGIGNIHVRMGDFLRRQGKDPTTELDAARKSLAQSTKIDPNYYYPHSNLGAADIVHARWAIKQRQSPVAYFNAARSAYLKSIQLNKEEPETYRFLAEVYRWEADWKIQQKGQALAAVAEGQKWIEKSLSLNKNNPDAIAVQGALFLLQARSEINAAERLPHAASAVSALEKALKINSLLRNEYEPLLKEAKAIQGH